MTTAYHAKYFANELMKRCPSDSLEKLAGALSDAQVDLNPHQIEAALFAFRSPLSRGAILADEVGLGKTIKAGLSLKNGEWFDAEMEKLDKWADDKRNSLRNDLRELDEQITEARKQVRQAGNLPDKLEVQKKIRRLEQKRDEAWKQYDDAAKDLETQKDQLISKVEVRLKQQIMTEELFTIEFELQ